MLQRLLARVFEHANVFFELFVGFLQHLSFGLARLRSYLDDLLFLFALLELQLELLFNHIHLRFRLVKVFLLVLQVFLDLVDLFVVQNSVEAVQIEV